MKQDIKAAASHPEKMEALYQGDKRRFAEAFYQVAEDLPETPLLQFWHIRMAHNHPRKEATRLERSHLLALFVSAIVAGFLIKLPEFVRLSVEPGTYYSRNVGLIVFFGMTLYTLYHQRPLTAKKGLITVLLFGIPALYMNLLPEIDADKLNLVYMHMVLLMWCLYGYIHIGFNYRSVEARMQYLKFNGDLGTLGAMILLAGMILTAITIGLFEVIDINIEKFYTEYVVIWGLTAAPMVTHFIIRLFPNLSNRIAPIIAQLFSPLVLITLAVYLAFVPFSGKNPYADRNFLLVFNFMLLGVMGLIVYAINETHLKNATRFMQYTLAGLTLITLIVDSVALTAIFYRLSSFGITPNRMAALGSNMLIFIHLLFIMRDFVWVLLRKQPVEKVSRTIAWYLPVYAVWTLIVVALFPWVF